jgi:nitroreductase
MMMMHSLPKLPEVTAAGAPLKPMPWVMLRRRATEHVEATPIPDTTLRTILELAGQAPSAYNLQPWRFIVVRTREDRARLRRVAHDQEKVGEAPVVVIAVGVTAAWRRDLDEVLREGARQGAGTTDDASIERRKRAALDFLAGMRMDVWVNRHVMIAVTYMMLAAESYGIDTAPMEGFDAEGVKREFGVPDEDEVVALLALGIGRKPDKAFPGRFGLSKIVYDGQFGVPWQGKKPRPVL